LLNLLGNALDALEGNGAAAGGGHRPGRIEVSLETGGGPGASLVLVVRDNGPGVASDVLERVADLFFTTKEVGKGTGLGLGIVHRIVDAHGGRVHLASTLGQGFAVRLELPRGQVS